MTITKEQNGENLEVKLEGRLDTTTAPELEASLQESIGNINSLTINLEKLEYISSAGLRVLLSAHKKMIAKEGLKVTNVCPDVMDVLDITGFSDILTIE